jgi:hypothetical protein
MCLTSRFLSTRFRTRNSIRSRWPQPTDLRRGSLSELRIGLSGVFRTDLNRDDGALAAFSGLFCFADDDCSATVGAERV